MGFGEGLPEFSLPLINPDTIKVTVRKCARCTASEHKDLEFKKFAIPVTLAGSDTPVATHWAMCPTRNEPILMIVVNR